MILYTDGGARGNPGPAASAAYLFGSEMEVIDSQGEYIGETTNNQAEYHGLLIGLELALRHNVTQLECRLDSELVVKQINGQYKVKDEKIKLVFSKVKKLLESFSDVTFRHVPRSENKLADALVNEVLDNHKSKTSTSI